MGEYYNTIILRHAEGSYMKQLVEEMMENITLR